MFPGGDLQAAESKQAVQKNTTLSKTYVMQMSDINLQNINHVSVKCQAGMKGCMGCLWGNGPATIFWLKPKVHLST